MGNTYNQLTLSERYRIQAYKDNESTSARYIGVQLNRSNKTISVELKRCPDGQYCAESAHSHALNERQKAAKASKETDHHQRLIYDLLEDKMSPDQISGRMKLEVEAQAVCRQTIYNWIAKWGWRGKLPRRGKKLRSKSGASAGVALIPNRVDIDERPSEVDTREEMGHWEGDTVYGQDGYLVTLVERVSLLLLVMFVPNKKKETVSNAVCKLLKPFRYLCKTITFDNGGEFADHEKISKKVKCDIYFAKPYCSWQRGTNENTNGLLRRYYPKGMRLGEVSAREIKNTENEINMRPRKALNYLSPLEFISGERVSLINGL